jgi:glyoxylase-like metal-dependent hydrolase (beta-lactamase superfamily II)
MIGGDLLFRGSIGRTDLPFSSGADMEVSLARIAALPGALPVFPGHGPSTTIAEELADNPFLNGTVLPVHR